jgi:hypothetical protein
VAVYRSVEHATLLLLAFAPIAPAGIAGSASEISFRDGFAGIPYAHLRETNPSFRLNLTLLRIAAIFTNKSGVPALPQKASA